jgi:16S rRNA processing protein RimM
MTEEEWVLLARLVRPQGRKGEVLAELLTDFPEKFQERKRVFLLSPKGSKPAPPREIQLENHWLHKGRVVLKFAGIDSINDAETLRGLDVAIPPEERATLSDDEVYISDLIGCHVYAGSPPADIGEVIDVDTDSTAVPLLELRGTHQDEILIPFAKAYLVRVDVPAKRIEMNIPEGLLEVNSPLSEAERAALKAESEGASAENDS